MNGDADTNSSKSRSRSQSNSPLSDYDNEKNAIEIFEDSEDAETDKSNQKQLKPKKKLIKYTSWIIK